MNLYILRFNIKQFVAFSKLKIIFWRGKDRARSEREKKGDGENSR